MFIILSKFRRNISATFWSQPDQTVLDIEGYTMFLDFDKSCIKKGYSRNPNLCDRSSKTELVDRVGGTTGSASDQQSTNDRKVAGSRPTKVVCITVLTGNRMG